MPLAEQPSTVTATDLSTFQTEMLYALARDGPLYGLAIKRRLEGRYDEKINHGRLYPNLDRLVDAELIDKTKRDDRTNEYSLTEGAKDLLRRDAQRRYNAADSLNGRFGGAD